MTVYIDNMFAQYGRMKMCHMMADTLEELHDMADKIGLRRKWFQNHPKYQHYDIGMGKRELAIAHGAIEITSVELVKMMRGKYPQNRKGNETKNHSSS